MAKLTKAQIDEARALYDAGKVEEGRALLQKYRDAPEPAAAPTPAAAPVKAAPRPVRAAAPRPPTAVAPPPRTPVPAAAPAPAPVSKPDYRLDPEAPVPEFGELHAPKPIAPPESKKSRIYTALEAAINSTTGALQDAGVVDYRGVTDPVGRQRIAKEMATKKLNEEIVDAPRDFEGKPQNRGLMGLVVKAQTTPDPAGLSEDQRVLSNVSRAVLPQVISSTPRVDTGPSQEERDSARRDFDYYNDKAKSALKGEVNTTKRYDLIEKMVREDSQPWAAEAARKLFFDAYKREPVPAELADMRATLIDTRVSRVLPQRQFKPREATVDGKLVDISRAARQYLTQTKTEGGTIVESLPAAAFRNVASLWQWAYEPLVNAMTYDVTPQGVPVDENDPVYKFGTEHPGVSQRNKLTWLPHIGQGRVVGLNTPPTSAERAAESVAKGEGLGSSLSRIHEYQRNWNYMGMGWVPQGIGVGLELWNPYLTPFGPLMDAGAGALGAASKGARVAGLGKTADLLEFGGDFSKALERSRSTAQATNIAKGTDVVKSVKPAYREAMEIASARNVVADKMAGAVIPVAMLDNLVTKAERMLAEHAQDVAEWGTKAKARKPDLTGFWRSYADSGLMDQPAVRDILAKLAGRNSPELELVELRKLLDEWKGNFNATASNEARHLYEMGKAQEFDVFSRAGAKFDMNGAIKRGKEYVNEELLNAVPSNLVFITPTVVADIRAADRILDDLGAHMKQATEDVKFKDGKAILPDGKVLTLDEYTRWFNDIKSDSAKKLLGDEAHEIQFTGKAAAAAGVPVELRSIADRKFGVLPDARIAGDVRKTPIKTANELTALRNELATIPDEVAAAIVDKGFARVVQEMGINSDAWPRAIKLYFGGDTHIPEAVLDTILKEKAGVDAAGDLNHLSVDRFGAVIEEIIRRRPDLGKVIPRKGAGAKPYPFAALAALATEYAVEAKIAAGYPRLSAAEPKFDVSWMDDEYASMVKQNIAHKLATGDLYSVPTVDVGRSLSFHDLDAVLGAEETARYMLLQWGATAGVKLGADSLGAIPELSKADDVWLVVGLDKADELARFNNAAQTGALARNLEALRIANDRASWAYAGELLKDIHRNTVGGMLGGRFAPNMRFHGTNFATAPLIIAATVGLPNAVGATGRLLDWQVVRHLVGPDTAMFVAKDGRTWTKQALEEAVAKNNIAFSQATFEFGPQIIEDMRAAAKVGIDGKPSPWMVSAADTMTPNLLRSSAFNKWAEKSDRLWRENVFVNALKAGRTEEEAAKLARESMLDYSAIPAAERDTIARYFLFYAFQRQMTRGALLSLANDPRTFQRTLQTQRAMSDTAERDTYLMTDQYMGRMGLVSGPTYDKVKKTVFVGPDAPNLSAVRDVLQVASWAARGSEGMGQNAAEAIVDRGSTPFIDTALLMSRYQPENKDTGRIDPHMIAALQYSGLWPWVVSNFDVVPVAEDRRRGGEPTFNGTESTSGRQYRFGSQTGYAKWLAMNLALTDGGIKRTLDDYVKTLIQAGVAPEGAEMKRLKDGSWKLYALGMQTPIALPTKLQAQVDAEEKVLRELLEVKKD